MAISTYLAIITLNVSGLNSPIKRHKVADWIKKQDPSMCYLQETHFRAKDTNRLKVRKWKNISCKRKIQGNRGNNTHISQNRL